MYIDIEVRGGRREERGKRREVRGEGCHRLGQHLENMIEESLPPNPKALLRTWVRGFRGERREEGGER